MGTRLNRRRVRRSGCWLTARALRKLSLRRKFLAFACRKLANASFAETGNVAAIRVCIALSAAHASRCSLRDPTERTSAPQRELRSPFASKSGMSPLQRDGGGLLRCHDHRLRCGRLPLDPHGVTAGGHVDGVAADDATRQHLALRVHHFEPRAQRLGQRLVEARGVLGVEERTAAGIRPAPERRRELLIVERESRRCSRAC